MLFAENFALVGGRDTRADTDAVTSVSADNVNPCVAGFTSASDLPLRTI